MSAPGGTGGSGEARLAALASDPARAGVFCDFDGTLAPIVDVPADARPAPGAVDALAALARRFRRVGVISGRPAAFLQEHLGGRGLFLAGLYGLETVEDGGDQVRVADQAVGWRPVVEEAADRARRDLAPPVTVEPKGLTVTLHFRADPSREDDVRAWAEGEAGRTGLAWRPGRRSFELRPPVDVDKGTALTGAAAGMGAACFLGDDEGDLAAFDALDRLEADGVATLRVGVESAEAPPALLERADLVVDGPDGVIDLLGRLAEGG